jgi:hypothetical protein
MPRLSTVLWRKVALRTFRGTACSRRRKAVERVEHRVAAIVGAAYVEHRRATLLALIELRTVV